MSLWENFLEDIEALNPFVSHAPKPGKVMVCFMNRYLEGLDDVKYKLVYDGKTTVEGKTSEADYCFELSPKTTNPIEVYVWSHKNKVYKRLDDVQPVIGKKVLARKIIKTIKVPGKTRPHKDEDTNKAVPKKTEPTKAAPPGPSPQGKQGVETTSKKDEQNKPIEQLQRPVPAEVTKEQLKKIFPQAKEDYLQQIADEVNTDPEKYKLDTVYRRAHFFGQLRQESGAELKPVEENLNYKASVLLLKFSYYRRHPDQATNDGRPDTSRQPLNTEQQKIIANKIYGSNGNGRALGNAEPNDGWNYRGRGLIQLTGRSNYKQITDSYHNIYGGNIDFIMNPELLKTPTYALRSAVWFWVTNKCWNKADDGVNDAAINAVTHIINSGGDGAEERRRYVKVAHLAFI